MPFRKTDKGPKGTYVLYDQLPDLFQQADISINYASPASKFKYILEEDIGYFIVAPYVDLMDGEVEALKNFVNRGNVLVISTYLLDEDLEEWMGVKLQSSFFSMDSVSVFDTDKDAYASFYPGRSFSAYINEYDSKATDLRILGKTGDKVNCISFKIGSGYVVLHTQPFMFSNYQLIKKKSKAYSEIFFSSLPGHITKIYWDEYTKGSSGGGSPLKYIKSQSELWNAFLWALAGLLLLLFFSFKRRQRIIPVIAPLSNNSLDMVRTVSDMYYFGKNNAVMAKKKIAHWLEFLRTKYNIFTTLPPEMFWKSVEMRSGMEKDKVDELRGMVELYRSGDISMSDYHLVRLNNLIDSFYKS